MAQLKNRRVALFSIRPAYAQAILDGTKHVEFRRTPLSPEVAHVVVYSTSPVQQVVGTFDVEGVDNDSPAVLWDRYAHVGGITRDAYDAYFTGCESAYAIRVRRPVPLATPLSLGRVRPGLRPPQSFQYLDEEAAARVDARLVKAPDLPAASSITPLSASLAPVFRVLRALLGPR